MYTKLQPYASTPPLYLFSILLFLCSALSYQQVCNHLDQSALLSFYDGFQSTSSPPLNWSASVTCCLWEGVACDINGRVTHLQLSSRGIQGVITSSLSNLVSLTHLNLSNNLFSGPLPDTFFGSMDSLQVIDLSSNQLSGNFSSRGSFPMKVHTIDISSNQFEENIGFKLFSKMKVLTSFNCSNNGFVGTIPSFICLSSPLLKTLDLSHNQFTGPILEEIGECSQLEVFRAGFNSLSGSNVPDSIFKLRKLIEISISDNDFHGPLKEGIVRLTNLRIIDFSSNHISGPIPQKIGNLLKLEKLHLENNNLSGPIPPSLMKCANLIDIILRSNSFDGEISNLDWSGLVRMQKLDLAYNNFNGTLPESIYSCKSLVAYRVAINNFSGQISPNIVELKSLSYLSISDNSFSNITKMLTVLSRCQNLSMLFLATNFQGEALPSEKSFLAPTGFPNLKLLSLANCRLTGFFPEWLSHIKTLQFLALTRNQITGKIPNWIGTFPSLSRLLLANNNLFGEIPRQLCQLPALSGNMDPKLYQIQSQLPNYASAPGVRSKQFSSWPTEINLGSNNLSGIIPLEIGKLQGLQVLYFGNNQLAGHIPLSITNLKSLIALDLSQNNLSGELPMTLADLHFLAFFNVSYNDLEGPIPTGGQFATFDESY